MIFFCCFIVDAVDTSKKGHKGKAWLGSDRDYIYDEVSRVNNPENKKKFRSDSGKVRFFLFSATEIRKNKKKSQGIREFPNFPRKLLVNRLLEIYFP